jgi:thioredoxin reductase
MTSVGLYNLRSILCVPLLLAYSGVTMLVRGPSLKGTMSSYLFDRILNHPKIVVLFNAEVTQLDGQAALERIALKDRKAGTTE